MAELTLPGLELRRLKNLTFQMSRQRQQQTYTPNILQEFLAWTKDLGTGPFGRKTLVEKRRKELQNEREEKIIPELEKAKDSHLVAAALVATVTFAAPFTLPGGYISDEKDPNLKDTPILSRNEAFKAFVVTDAIAMVLSTLSVLIHFIMVILGYKQR
ncbi:ankyrin repeat family protein [Euphorbia peplus]|nr:ankyrin repeat family protein [Euphorbia peplus]